MEEHPNGKILYLKTKTADKSLDDFIAMHLNRIYYAKAYLVKQLPEVKDLAGFSDLKIAIEETIGDIKIEILRIEKILQLLDTDVSSHSIAAVTGIIEDMFSAVNQQHESEWKRDMSILYYLQSIESMNISSFQILQLAAQKMKNQDIFILLRENVDQSKKDSTLFLSLSEKYF